MSETRDASRQTQELAAYLQQKYGHRFLVTKELAAELRRNVTAVQQMRHRGTGPKGTKVGRDVLYDVRDVATWMADKGMADAVGQRAAA